MCARDRLSTVYLLSWLVFACIVEPSLAKVAKIDGSEYVGCYRDQSDPRLLRGRVQDYPTTLTPQLCVVLCKQKGYIYAGLEATVQCFCGDEELPASAKVDDSDCSGKCGGDRTVFCGSGWRLLIYKTGNSESNMAKLAELPGKEYVGCYKDSGDPRRLSGHITDFPDTLTPQLCVGLCKPKDYIYAGLEYGVQCFCGDDELPDSAKVDDKECSGKCSGDRSALCGGISRITVYKTGNPESNVVKLVELPGKEYVGCYKDPGDPRRLAGHITDFPETLTPQVCVGLCEERGYIYAGLEYGVQCFCGDDELPDSAKVDDKQCSGKCTGDRLALCGGIWRVTVYKTGNPESSRAKVAELPGKEYVGCYSDNNPRRLQGHSQDFKETLTPQLCVGLCKQRGFIYAGLEYGVQCFCGDDELPASARVDEGECSGKCTGDRSAICGAIWRLTIYKTGNSGASVADIGYQYMGCYRDENHRRKLSGSMTEYPETLTPQYCVTVCKQKNFLFAGLQNGLQCFCGNEFPSFKDKVPESECNSKCSGELTAICGAALRNTIYTTANKIDSTIQNECITSVSKVNGKAACQNEVVFEDHFNSLSLQNWSHVIEIPNEPDYQFVIFNSDPANSYTADGKLVIKPTLLPDSEVRSGDLHLENCTGNAERGECGYKARSYVILPPVQSAQLTTRKSFSFQYGKLEISAKLPAGDWLVPEIWLEPTKNVYGHGYASGKVRIAMSRGNSDLKLYGNDIGSKELESGILMGIGDNIRGRTVRREISDGWHNDYHTYSVIWTPENIIFTIDGEQPYSLVSNSRQTLSSIVGFTPSVTHIWDSASKIAPFDNEFYISLGVSAGGIRNFPDNVMNNGKPKPWKNLELKAMLNFWRQRDSWKRTWHDDTALLKVDYVKVTAL